MQLSIVSTLYRSSGYLEEFVRRMTHNAEQLVSDYELILINDGSPDDSLDVAVSLMASYPHLQVVDLSRNFGHHKALMTGLTLAEGERVFIIDADLEEPPELLVEWWRQMDSDPDLDMVYGVQIARKGNSFERITGEFFYRIVNMVSKVKLTPNMIVARLMTREFVRNLVRHKDRELYLFGLMVFTGFHQKSMPVVKAFRGDSTYSPIARFALAINAICNFTTLPLYGIFYGGLLMALLAFLFSVVAIINRLFDPNMAMGWTSLFASIWIVGGCVLTAIGIVAIYQAKIFAEVKDRPLTIIRKIYPARSQTCTSMSRTP